MPRELAPTAPAESRVSVQIHPGRLLGAELPLTALSLQGGPDEPTSSGTTSRSGPNGAQLAHAIPSSAVLVRIPLGVYERMAASQNPHCCLCRTSHGCRSCSRGAPL